MNKSFVKRLLENYSTNEAKTKYCEAQGIELYDYLKEFEKLKEYIKVMDDELQMVLNLLYVKKLSIRGCTRECHLCYKTIIRKRDKAIAEITEVLGFGK